MKINKIARVWKFAPCRNIELSKNIRKIYKQHVRLPLSKTIFIDHSFYFHSVNLLSHSFMSIICQTTIRTLIQFCCEVQCRQWRQQLYHPMDVAFAAQFAYGLSEMSSWQAQKIFQRTSNRCVRHN